MLAGQQGAGRVGPLVFLCLFLSVTRFKHWVYSGESCMEVSVSGAGGGEGWEAVAMVQEIGQ